MTKFLRSMLFCFFLIALQVLVLNQVHLLEQAMPFVYIYFLMKLPHGTRSEYILLMAFAMGLTVDCFSNTSGMYAAACTAMAFAHPGVVYVLIDKEYVKGVPYSFSTCGYRTFIFYVLALTVVHNAVLLMVEALTVFHFGLLLRKLLMDIIATTGLICLFELLRSRMKIDG